MGPSDNEASAIKVYDEGFARPSDITLDGVLFQEYIRDPGVHTERLQRGRSTGSSSVSRASACAVTAISSTASTTPSAHAMS